MKRPLRERLTFGQKDRLALWIFHQHGHHAAGEVEWNLVQLLVLLDQRLLVEVGTIQNCAIDAGS